MLSNRFYILIFFGFKVLAYFGLASMTFNLSSRIFQKSFHGFALLKLHLLPAIAWVVFTFCQSIRFYGSGELDSFNLNVICTLMGLFSLEYLLVSIHFSDEIISVTNTILLFLRKMNRLYMPHYNPNKELYSKLFDVTIVLLFGALAGMGGLSSIYFYLFPFSPCLFGSAIPSTTFAPFRLFMLYIFPHYLTVVMVFSPPAIMLPVILFGLIVVPFLIKELTLDRKSYLSSRQLRTPSNIILVYRSSHILISKILVVLEYMIVPTQTIVTNVTLFSSVMLIKHGDKMSMASKGMLGSWSVVAAVGWTLALWVPGYMHYFGKKLLNSWKYHKWTTRGDKAVMSKFRKSCKPFMIHFGKVYAIRRLSVLKFIRSISRGIFRTLMTVGSNKR